MTEGLNGISAQLKSIESEVLEFKVGVSHIALDEEREKNTRIRERVEFILADLEKQKGRASQQEVDYAQRILTAATSNTETLRYLESISCLEGIFTDVTKAATFTAVQLSARDRASTRVLSTRLLANNVKQCWDYTSKLHSLTAVHLTTAAEYHMFHHEVNEVRAHARRLKKLSATQLASFLPDGRFGEASTICGEMNERLQAFSSLAERGKFILQKAPSILPIESRLLEVRDGKARGVAHTEPLMVQLLVDYVGGDCNLAKGESFPLLDTIENPYLWKVQTSKGPQYLPSVICIVTSLKNERITDAYGTLAAVKDAWKNALENYTKQLIIYYTKTLETFGHGRGIRMADAQAQRNFLNDLDSLLLKSGFDDGRLARAMEVTANTTATAQVSNSEDVLNLSEILALHRPLQILKDHFRDLMKIDEIENSPELRLNGYISTIATEARDVDTRLQTLRMTHDRNETELKKLYDRVRNWKSVYAETIEAPKTGVGRLVLSSLSTSSGVSSEDFDPIPRPPSPIGRIAAMELSNTDDALSEAIEEVHTEPSRVFTGGANLHLPAATTFKPKPEKKPQMIRDVAVQVHLRRIIQNTQTDRPKFATAPNEPNRVDCMTQIGVMKFPKEQQVDVSLISAAMQVEGHRPSFATASEEAFLYRKEETYSTYDPRGSPGVVELSTRCVKNKDQLNQTPACTLETGESGTVGAAIKSGTFKTNVPTRDGTFETDKSQLDCMLQVQPVVQISDIDGPKHETQSFNLQTSPGISAEHLRDLCYSPMSCESEIRTTQKRGEFHTRPKDLVSETLEFLREDDQQNSDLNSDISSVQFETARQPTASFDATTQVVAQSPIVTRVHDGRRKRYERRNLTLSSYAQCETPPICHQEASNAPRSTASCQVGTVLVPREVKVSAINVGIDDKVLAGELNVPMHSILCPATVECQAVLTEEGGIQIVDLKDVGQLNIQTREAIFTAGVHTSKPHKQTKLHTTIASSSLFPGEVCTMECETSDVEIEHEDITFLKECSDRGTMARRFIMEAECQFSITGRPISSLDHSNKLPSHAPRSISHSSTQVGLVLTPTNVRIGGINAKARNNSTAGLFGVNVNSSICPSSLELVSGLTEAGGIQVKEICEFETLNLPPEGSVYHANVHNQAGISTTLPGSQRHFVNLSYASDGWAASGTIVQNVDDSWTPRQLRGEFEFTSPKTEGVCSFCKNGEKLIESANTTPISSYHATYSMEHSNKPLSTHQQSSTWKSKTVECQVGTRIRPIAVQVEKMTVKPRDSRIAEQLDISMNSLLCPIRVQMQPELTDLPGIEIIDLADTSTIEFQAGGMAVIGDIQTRSIPSDPSKRRIMHLDIRGDLNGLTVGQTASQFGASRGKTGPDHFTLRDIGCEVALRRSIIGRICTSCNGSGKVQSTTTSKHPQIDRVEMKVSGSGYLDSFATPCVKHASSQVGTVLIPKRLQVASMSMGANERRAATSMGLEANAIICPSTIELESKLTETAGLTVVDVRDVKELGITVGRKQGLVSVSSSGTTAARRHATTSQPEDSAYLTFICAPSPDFVGTQTVHKPIDQSATCTFQIRDAPCATLKSDTFTTKPETPLVSGQQESVSCQVGVMMIPSKIHIVPGTISVEDKPGADALGVSIGSTWQQTTHELQTRLFEKSGIDIVKITEVDHLDVQIGQERFEASVDRSGCKAKTGEFNTAPETLHIQAYSTDPQTWSNHFASTSSKIGSYMVAQADCSAPNESILEVSGLSLDGQTMQLRVEADLRGKVHMQTSQVADENRKNSLGHWRSPGRSIAANNRVDFLTWRRPDSRLCDVACEALIKPETMEKRLQTSFL